MRAEIDAGVDLCCLPERKIAQRVRQLARFRHTEAVNEDRYYRNLLRERCFDFDSNPIRFVGNGVTAMLISAKPPRPDHGKEDIAAIKRLLQIFPEIQTDGYRVYVHKDIAPPVMSLEPVKNAAGNPLRVVSAI